MTVWRLQTNTDSKTKLKIANYCVENRILAMGWSPIDDHLKADLLQQAITDRGKIMTYEDYCAFLERYGVYGGKVNPNVNRFYYEVQENDLVWIRSDGIYYLGRVTDKSYWQYDSSQNALDLDASNQITNIEWYKIGDESDVPGAITTALIRGQTLQRIKKEGVEAFSQLIYNEKANRNVYPDCHMEQSAATFYNLLSPDDCEDLLCLWLYAKYGYVVIPSTNKKATECYECVLKDPKTGRSIYPQVKAGEENLDRKKYMHLDGEVWLFTTKGKVEGDEAAHIYTADPQELYEFVGSDIANNILSQSILGWYQKLKQI